MANNLFVSCDLFQSRGDYKAIIAEIQRLGAWKRIHFSLWYVKSPYTSQQAHARISSVMGRDDRLIVIDVTNRDATWANIGDDVAQFIQTHWLP